MVKIFDRSLRDRKNLYESIGIAVVHVILHYVGFVYIMLDPEKNVLFVTITLATLHYIYNKYLEQKVR